MRKAERVKLTRSALLRHFNCTPSALARTLKVSRQWVHDWPDHKPIPEIQEMRLRYELFPETDWDRVARGR